jgi:cytochrome P450
MDLADLDDLEYFDLFLKESMRLKSPSFMTFDRIVLSDFKLGKYTLEKGIRLIITNGFSML